VASIAAPSLLAVPLAFLASGCAMIDGLTGGGCDATPFFVAVDQPIPDNNGTGVSSFVNASNGTIDGVTVSTVTEHVYPGELNYELSHNGFFVTLDGEGSHDVDAFDGMSAGGSWVMRIWDDVAADEGYWYSWEIAICVSEGGETAPTED
jgi:subtilisin-like proprotein convertase family protein